MLGKNHHETGHVNFTKTIATSKNGVICSISVEILEPMPLTKQVIGYDIGLIIYIAIAPLLTSNSILCSSNEEKSQLSAIVSDMYIIILSNVKPDITPVDAANIAFQTCHIIKRVTRFVAILTK